MNKRWKQISVLLLGTAIVLNLNACGMFTKSYDYAAVEDSIYVGANGVVKAAMVADFDKDYYSVSELESVAKAQALEYNETYYGLNYSSTSQMTKDEQNSILLPVSFESATAENGKANIVYSYANGDIYTSFNSVEIASKGGTKAYTSRLESNTMDLEGSFVTVDGSKTVTKADFADEKDYVVVYVDFPVSVYGEHDIAYVSTNVTVIGNNCASVTGTDGSYIIFK